MIEQLLARLGSADDTQAEAAAQALALYGEAALPGLRGLVAPVEVAPEAVAPGGRSYEGSDAPASQGGEARWWAARALALIDSPEAVRLLRGLLGDPEVRACAIAGLGERARVESIPDLIAVLSDADSFVARLAGDALIRIGRPAVPELTRALADPASQQRRIQAARALAHLAAPESIPALFRALEDDSMFVQHWADEGLERLGVGMVYFNA